MVLPFRDAFAVFRLRVLSVGAGELAFLDCGATDLAFLRGLRRVITKVDSKVRSLESPAWAGPGRLTRVWTASEALPCWVDVHEFQKCFLGRERFTTTFDQRDNCRFEAGPAGGAGLTLVHGLATSWACNQMDDRRQAFAASPDHALWLVDQHVGAYVAEPDLVFVGDVERFVRSDVVAYSASAVFGSRRLGVSVDAGDIHPLVFESVASLSYDVVVRDQPSLEACVGGFAADAENALGFHSLDGCSLFELLPGVGSAIGAVDGRR